MKREFGTMKNSLIKDRIVLGINNTKTRERLLRVPDLTLEKALDVVRSAEATEMQMKELMTATHQCTELERIKTSQPFRKHPLIMKKKVKVVRLVKLIRWQPSQRLPSICPCGDGTNFVPEGLLYCRQLRSFFHSKI